MQITMEELNVIDKLPHYCPVCAYHEWNLDGLVEMIWDYIDVLRIYTKPKVRDYDSLGSTCCWAYKRQAADAAFSANALSVYEQCDLKS